MILYDDIVLVIFMLWVKTICLSPGFPTWPTQFIVSQVVAQRRKFEGRGTFVEFEWIVIITNTSTCGLILIVDILMFGFVKQVFNLPETFYIGTFRKMVIFKLDHVLKAYFWKDFFLVLKNGDVTLNFE